MLLFGSIWYIHLTLGEELLLKEHELFFFSLLAVCGTLKEL